MKKIYLLIPLLFVALGIAAQSLAQNASQMKEQLQEEAQSDEQQDNSRGDRVSSDRGGREERRRAQEQEVLQSCPFASSQDAREVAGRLQTAIQDLRSREACAGEIVGGNADQAFSDDLSALAQMRLDFSCQNLRNVRSDRDFVLAQASRDDFATSVIPREYQTCINVTQTNNRNIVGLDTACVNAEFQYLSSAYERDCQAAEAEGRYRLELNNTTEAIGNVVTSLSGMIENPQCAPGDMLGGIARAGVNALPLLASSIPGYGFGLASIARLATSLLTRLFSGRDPNVEIHEMFEEEYMRCLHMYSTGVALQCGLVQARETPSPAPRQSTREDQWVGPIRMLQSQLANEESQDLAAIFVALDERSINLPSGARTLRQILEDVDADLNQGEPSRLDQLKSLQIRRVLDLEATGELEGSHDQVVPTLLDWLGRRYPSSRGPLIAAMAGRPSGGPPMPDANANTNPSLVHVLFSEELLDQHPNTYGIRRVNSLSSRAHNVAGDTIENRTSNLINKFNICAYNAGLLLTSESRLGDAYDSGGSIATAINYDVSNEDRNPVFRQFHSACSEFDCIIDIPRRFNDPQGFASWQCNNINNQASISSALNRHVRAWANLNDGRSLCATPLNSNGGESQEGVQ